MFEPKHNRKANIETNVKQKKKIEFKYVDSIQLHENHKLWEMSPNGEIKEAEYGFSLNKTITWEQAVRKQYLNRNGKALYKKDHMYCSAMNLKNAKKQFSKMKKSNQTIKGKEKPKNPIKL